MALSAPSSRGRLYGTVATGAAAAGALAYIGLGDPHRPGFLFPACPFHAMTGLYCPGCGGLRMTHDILHGDLAAAVTDNVVCLVGLPMLFIWVLVRWRMGKSLMTASMLVVILVTAITWTVVRNLPGFPLVPTLLGG